MSTPFDDEDTARRVEALYKTDDAVRRRRAVLEELDLQPGERAIDIGTGPGFLACEMAERIGSSGEILGVDVSGQMLSLARERCRDKPQVRFEAGDAVLLPASDASFDIAISVQVYEYVANVQAALAEMYRVLRPGGRCAIVATDWRSIAWNSSNDMRMQRVLSAFAEHCAHQDLPRALAIRLRSVGFELRRQQVLPQFNPTYDSDTYSYGLIRLIASFVAGRAGISETEAAEWAADLHQAGDRGDYFFCLNQYLASATKPSIGRGCPTSR